MIKNLSSTAFCSLVFFPLFLSCWPGFLVAGVTTDLIRSLRPSCKLAFWWLSWPLVQQAVSVHLIGVACTCSSDWYSLYLSSWSLFNCRRTSLFQLVWVLLQWQKSAGLGTRSYSRAVMARAAGGVPGNRIQREDQLNWQVGVTYLFWQLWPAP